ncbi:MAG: SMC-Scp complex subunit ScpB [Chitinophagales bacterium]|nr:SMC-Scp complex subunit ScpB [Chitinophagales bacterium]HAE35834.1 SMC-Scp complex subunit ScpB [Bacteroidota bacterium]MCB9022169.1 SMC-Scp complex subunit ScpB [Chitinophagales bacterium]MCB9031931.1 SMC-Scp complex subunit ScpB [Chitinophagales bacterium]HPE97604.1 SMC-Scp complex subunit ScpB [Chitinophagales bacterium]
MDKLQQILEALIFSSEQPISVAELQTVLFTYSGEEVSLEAIQELVDQLKTKYDSDDYVFEILQSGGGYQFLSKPLYHKPISTLLQHRAKRKLSTAALECLSIIAYSQPVTKTDIEQIRGVNCDYTLQKLLERDLIRITGRADTPGKPLQYGTTQFFMDYFGINALDELPKLKEFEQKDLSIGDPGDIIVSAEENDDHTITLKVSAERREDAQNQQHEENIEQTGGSEEDPEGDQRENATPDEGGGETEA